MSIDGVVRSGTFVCIHSQLERLKTEGVVDVFQAIKSAQIHRPGIIPNSLVYYLQSPFPVYIKTYYLFSLSKDHCVFFYEFEVLAGYVYAILKTVVRYILYFITQYYYLV